MTTYDVPPAQRRPAVGIRGFARTLSPREIERLREKLAEDGILPAGRNSRDRKASKPTD